MNEHTPGKLAVEEMLMIGTDSTTMIADCSCAVSRDSWSGSDYATRAHREANARRLTLCWNAFDSITTEDVEELVSLGGVSALIEAINKLRVPRGLAEDPSESGPGGFFQSREALDMGK